MTYLAFGVFIASDLDFSDMLQESTVAANISIDKGQIVTQKFESSNVFRKGLQAGISIKQETIFLHWEGLMSCEIKNGTEIIYDHLGDDVQTLKLFLLREAIGILLAQRGFYLLHGTAVLINESAHVFIGEPGAGKSTTAAAFWKAGFTVLTDDLVAIEMNNDQAFVIPAFPQFKIWEHAVHGLGINQSELQPSFEGHTKFLLSQNKKSFPSSPIPLKSIQILSNVPIKHRINPLEAPIELVKHFPLPNQLLHGELHNKHFKDSLKLYSIVKIQRLQRPEGFDNLMEYIKHFTNEA